MRTATEIHMLAAEATSMLELEAEKLLAQITKEMAEQTYFCTHCVSISTGKLSKLNGWCPACEKWSRNEPPLDPWWETKDGAVVKFSDMTTSHIQFSIGKIMHEPAFAAIRGHYMEPLLRELKRRREKEDDDARRQADVQPG